MNAQTYISVSGQTIETPAVLPDRKFRDAWVLDANGAVTLDPVKRAEIAKRLFRDAIEAHIESVARSKDYADATRLASYVASTNATWAAEAQAFVAWRDAVWAFAYAELADVLAGLKPEPTIADFVADLPEIAWP
jgi:hypothetical protein